MPLCRVSSPLCRCVFLVALAHKHCPLAAHIHSADKVAHYFCGCRSRALGESSRLALHQGLQYYDPIEKNYKVGKFFSVRDQSLRTELSELKEQYPELPVDAGNLYRAF